MTEPAVHPRPAGAAVSQPYPRRWLALYVLVLARVMDLFDGAVTSVAGPSIQASFGSGYAELQWFSAAYTLALGAGLIAGARLGDRFGRRRVLLTAVAGFTAASALCGLAPSAGALIAFRLLQGGFAAMMVPQQLGLVKTMFAPHELPKVFGVLGPAIGLATVAAPLLGGLLLQADLFGTGWRAVFLVNLPAGVVLFAGTRALVAESRSPRPQRLDVLGIGLLAASAVLVLLPLVQGRELGWPPWMFGVLAAAAPVLLLFLRHERRVQARGGSPVVVPGLLRTRSFLAGLAMAGVFYAAVQGFMLVLMLYLQVGLGRSPMAAGSVLIAWSAGAAISSTVAGLYLVRRFGRRGLHAGLAVMAASYTAIALVPAPTEVSLAPLLFVAGIGMGLVLAPFLSIVLWGVDNHEIGSASGLLNTAQQLAGALGVAVLGSVFLALGGDGGLAAAFRPVCWLVAGLLTVSFALAFFLPKAKVVK